MKSFVIKGDICWSRDSTTLSAVKDGYLVCVDGVSQGVFSQLPEEYNELSVEDYTGKLVIPGMVDLHIHAPQYSFRGLGMDLELLDWLQAYTFPEEAKYADPAYAAKAYGSFVSHMKGSATTRAVVFATVHRDATILLMDMLEDAGLVSYVGKVNMDRNGPDDLCESGAQASAGETVAWLREIQGRYGNTMPILTPRFLPSCSDELLQELHRIQTDFGLPVQSHLSENPEEVRLVQRLFPDASCYGDGYERYGLFGGSAKTVMAHCVYSTPEEVELLRKNGVFVAHCPASNMNLASGIAPIRRYLDRGIRVGLGSDVAGGESESMFRAISDCVQVSKLYWRLVDQDCRPISFEEAFSLATVGGGRFFGNVGSFDPGFALDALVLDDKDLCDHNDLTVQQRTQRAVYLEADCSFLVAKYVNGREILQNRGRA